jgi:enterochelin esterase-like enzyme
MGPSSKTLLVLVILCAVAMFVLLAMTRRLVLKIVAAVAAFVLTLGAGVLLVNDYYGYYTTWGSAVADISGKSNAYAAAQAATQVQHNGRAVGRIEVVNLPGGRSGINRQGLVYLPPQYFERAYRHVRFPVAELFHGTPGAPSQWINQMRVTEIVARLIDARAMGPMVLVLPDSNGGFAGKQECLNTPAFRDDTYVTQDVRTDIQKRFRVSHDPGQWGMLGVSSGGYCAANLMMRHRTDWGAAASIDGYFRPEDGTAGYVLRNSPALQAANDPQDMAAALRPGSEQLPPLWLAAGTGVHSDFEYSQRMAEVMRHLEAVPFLVMPGAHHTMAAIRAALPSALIWLWQQVCTPDQRREFPTIETQAGATVYTAPVRHLLVTTTRVHGRSVLTLGGRTPVTRSPGLSAPSSRSPHRSTRHAARDLRGSRSPAHR